MTGNPDGTGRTPFPGNIIPLNRQSAITRQMVALIPMPNLPGDNSNYFASAGQNLDSRQLRSSRST